MTLLVLLMMMMMVVVVIIIMICKIGNDDVINDGIATTITTMIR